MIMPAGSLRPAGACLNASAAASLKRIFQFITFRSSKRRSSVATPLTNCCSRIGLERITDLMERPDARA